MIKKLLAIVVMVTFSLAAWSNTDKKANQEETNANENVVVESSERVFGQWLFEGNFANTEFTGVNPSYRLNIGDNILVQLWGAYEYQQEHKVDRQGNIFIPKVGPVSVLGVENKQLNQTVKRAVKTVYKNNVGVYATLVSSQPVKIYVTGYVKKPGLYGGLSADSILAFIDKARGIDPERGSFIDVRIIRDGETFHKVNLYQFIEDATLPNIQLQDGDRILVKERKKRASITGSVLNAFFFEFEGDSTTIGDMLVFAKPVESSTHIKLVRVVDGLQNAEYLSLSDAYSLPVQAGDLIEVVSENIVKSISVNLAGEHLSSQELIVPWGTTLGSILPKIEFTSLSKPEDIQLFRQSVKLRQKEMLQTSLKSLEQSVLTARAETNEAAALRQKESELILQWVERAKAIEPRGQVILSEASTRDDIVLEQGDVIRIPRKSNLIMVHGEVLFPNAVAFDQNTSVEDYINLAGGYTQDPDDAIVMLLKTSGRFQRLDNGDLDEFGQIEPGDEIFVLPDVDFKSTQVAKDITQIIYQIAVSAAVVLTL